MANVLVLFVMFAAGMIPLLVSTAWMKAGKVGYTLTLFSILGACLAISMQASTRLMGIDPIKAIGAALIVFLPATIGCAVGALLGWMIERRRVKRFQRK
jgi:membrane protein YqaA with SNARE-associated domain